MPLSDRILNQGLSRFMDPASSSFKAKIDGKTGSLPKDGEDLGEFWSKAIISYTATLAPPPVNTVIWVAGLEAMRRILSVALRPAALPDPTNLVFEQTFNLAFTAYGTALGVIRATRDSGKNVKVIATETRPIRGYPTETRHRRWEHHGIVGGHTQATPDAGRVCSDTGPDGLQSGAASGARV